jgi:hypothetical protein
MGLHPRSGSPGSMGRTTAAVPRLERCPTDARRVICAPCWLAYRHSPDTASPSSRGLGHRPFTAVTRVRISLGTPLNQALTESRNILGNFPVIERPLASYARFTVPALHSRVPRDPGSKHSIATHTRSSSRSQKKNAQRRAMASACQPSATRRSRSAFMAARRSAFGASAWQVTTWLNRSRTTSHRGSLTAFNASWTPLCPMTASIAQSRASSANPMHGHCMRGGGYARSHGREQEAPHRIDEKIDRFATRWSVPQHFRGQGPVPVVSIACNTLNAPSCLIYLRHKHSVQGQAEPEPGRHYREIKC